MGGSDGVADCMMGKKQDQTREVVQGEVIDVEKRWVCRNLDEKCGGM